VLAGPYRTARSPTRGRRRQAERARFLAEESMLGIWRRAGSGVSTTCSGGEHAAQDYGCAAVARRQPGRQPPHASARPALGCLLPGTVHQALRALGAQEREEIRKGRLIHSRPIGSRPSHGTGRYSPAGEHPGRGSRRGAVSVRPKLLATTCPYGWAVARQAAARRAAHLQPQRQTLLARLGSSTGGDLSPISGMIPCAHRGGRADPNS